MKRILICAGGTGGHIFPAIALVEELKHLDSSLDILFAGGKLDTNPFFSKQLYPYRSISCSPLPFSQPWKLPQASWQIVKGIRQSQAIIHNYRPDLIVGFGSYYTLPVLAAARLEKVPYILHEANSIPGKVNRLMASRAILTATHFPDVKVRGKTLQVSMPLREGCRKGDVSRAAAAAYYDLDPNKKTLLILGGSQGARAINDVVSKTEFPFEQIIHLTGKTLAHPISGRVIKDFEPEMQHALTLADAAVCRAGAGTIAELIEFDIPAVLIPYPQASENHQETNANFFSQKVGGGVVLLEKAFNPLTLIDALQSLDGCRNNIATYKSKHAYDSFGNLITQTLERLGHG